MDAGNWSAFRIRNHSAAVDRPASERGVADLVLGLHQRVWLMRGGSPAVGDGLIGKQCFNCLACHRDAERGDFDGAR
ncbi:diheme cytochrome c [Stutzerimonas stutzeri]|uniref:diheme cytochrome c n=1 Tax=Stutzerimonas stutzeri TaxID=316 RepID=UPI00210AA70D|nr:diheme cytochrome c [Stutzerimonas stutzeri]MCQ4320498.1 diheme cytochrome c [Stutzerimonas stutzeri]